MEIKTERLVLREYTMTDITDFYKLKSCKAVWEYSTFNPLEDLPQAQVLLRQQIMDIQTSRSVLCH